jgi:GntR family transcriptional regulator
VSPPQIEIDTATGMAAWRQVHDQIERLVSIGTLPPGTPLPTIRQLARDLGLAAGTVARAYRELETAGVVHTARRQGTVVAAAPASRRPDPLRQAAADYVARARGLGIPEDQAVAQVRALYR